MLTYKGSGKDIIERLKGKGYSTARIRKENLLNESILSYLRRGQMIGTKALEKLCELLQCQPGDIIVSIDPDTGRPHGKGRKSS